MLGIEVPILALSYSRDVVAEVTLAGGCGVLGGALFTPEELDEQLAWIEERVDGRPYGLDLIVPKDFEGKDDDSTTPENAVIPPSVTTFVEGILRDHEIDPASVRPVPMSSSQSMSEARAAEMIEVALEHGVGLLANALGTPPPAMFEAARSAGIPIGALVGTKRQALAQLESGLDFIVAQGGEAGGHTGLIGTMVIVPEVVQTVRETSDIPVLAAGGIATGRQMAAAMALGADGVWTGTVWLTTHESEITAHNQQKLLAAHSSDTVRSVARTGKPSRQLRSPWHDAWERPGSPAPLPMPVMSYVSEPPLRRADVLAEEGHAGAQRLSTYWAGQTVGVIDELRSVRQVVADITAEYAEVVDALPATLAETNSP
jgi:NAD(P)H-dependent flavin oxidoreductase YrpB (nitropropane dioxygenase family)